MGCALSSGSTCRCPARPWEARPDLERDPTAGTLRAIRGTTRAAAAGAPRVGALAGAPALAESLKGETTARGFSPDLKPFHAHVTVARKVARAPAAQPLSPVQWTVDGFALIESRTEPTGPVYSVIESYLLAKTENEHE